MAQPVLKPQDDAPDHDPFYWGSRWVYVTSGGGRRLTQIPLSREDILDPQEGDMMPQSPLHGLHIRDVADRLDRWFLAQGRDDVAVFDNVKMLWGIPGLENPAPDISVVWPENSGSRASSSEPSALTGTSIRIEATLRSVYTSSR